MSKRRRNKISWRPYALIAFFIACAICTWYFTNYTEARNKKHEPVLKSVQDIGSYNNNIDIKENKSAEDKRDIASSQPSMVEELNLRDVVIPTGTVSQIIDYPGFRMSFNADAHQPNWVAWELTRDKAKTNVVGKRKNNFAPDPKIPGCATLADYNRSGYDRGHMAPAADMKWSREASDACFLLTNMSPQNNKLNTGAWRTLEEKCRDIALRDSAIVIICGPILTDRMTRKIGDTGVPVPERYFKVILSPYTKPMRGIGFIMPNAQVEGGMQTTAMSIDEVEAITGFDFFSGLDDDVEAQVESQSNFLKWSRK